MSDPQKPNGAPVPIHMTERYYHERVVVDSGCWLWQGFLDRHGYGRIGFTGGGSGFAHRIAYQALKGPIPPGLELDHLCRRPACVNPEHLEPVTHAENMRRGAHGMATHCKHGHPFDAENTRRKSNGGRTCKICDLAAGKRYRDRKKAQS